MSPALLLLAGWLAMALVMALLWAVQRARGDAGIADAGWAAGIAAIACAAALLLHGAPARRVLVAALALAWGVRLAAHVLHRVRTLPEDGRYGRLRARWGARQQAFLFGFFQLQAFWSALFAVPMVAAAANPTPFPSAWDGAALLVWGVALLGESAADRQLRRFRANPANRGRVCRDGLWGRSRHPNYFFEWLHWFAWLFLALGGPLWWAALAGPLLMLWFLTKVTGIPPTEEQALASRGEAYRDYQRTVNAFFPSLRRPA